MNLHVRRWGNSAAVRIPGAMLAGAKLSIDDAISIRHEDGRIIIEPAISQSLKLDALVALIAPDNLHAEVDYGPAVGNEAW